MTPGQSWLLLLVLLGALVLGSWAAWYRMTMQEAAANEPLTGPGWTDMAPEATTVRTIPAPYDRTQEVDPI